MGSLFAQPTDCHRSDAIFRHQTAYGQKQSFDINVQLSRKRSLATPKRIPLDRRSVFESALGSKGLGVAPPALQHLMELATRRYEHENGKLKRFPLLGLSIRRRRRWVAAGFPSRRYMALPGTAHNRTSITLLRCVLWRRRRGTHGG